MEGPLCRGRRSEGAGSSTEGVGPRREADLREVEHKPVQVISGSPALPGLGASSFPTQAPAMGPWPG